VRLAHSSGKEIICDRERGICHFEYNKYKNGKKESVCAVFESLESVKAKLALVGELGFMGISFDVMNVPVEYLMMFETMFSRPEL
jgi:spore germination protein YaaH